MYDVCIIGAGPAGSTLARAIGSRHRVLLVDRRELDRPWSGGASKPCGGLLAPRAQAELARQGLGLPRDILSGPQLFAVRTLDLETSLERLYQRFYVGVDRERFDRWLVSLVPDGVDTAFGWRADSIDRAGGVPLVHFETPGGGHASVEARLVVGADGAASIAGQAAAPSPRAARRYTAVQAVFSAEWDEPHYGAVFDARLTDFYGWTIPRADSLVAGAAFGPGPGVGARFDTFVARLRERRFGLGDERSRVSAPIVRPMNPLHVAFGADDIVLVGEAAGLISPSSAEGISYALRSGAALGRALECGLQGASDRYRIAALPLAAEVCGKLVKSYAVHDPVLRRLVMSTGVGAIHRVAASRRVDPVPVA